MQYSGNIQKLMTALLLIAAILGTYFVFGVRAENNIQRMTEACEQSGRVVEFTSISWSGSVSGRCVVKSRSGDQESDRVDD